MAKILVPVSGGGDDRFALQAVVRRFMNDGRLEVHLLHVQPPNGGDVSRPSSRRTRHDHRHQQAAKALALAREQLDRLSVPCAVHRKTGDSAQVIAALARQLHCAAIVMATARDGWPPRWLRSSVTDRVIALSAVPVEVVAGEPLPSWRRYGVPAMLGAAGAALVGLLIFVD